MTATVGFARITSYGLGAEYGNRSAVTHGAATITHTGAQRAAPQSAAGCAR